MACIFDETRKRRNGGGRVEMGEPAIRKAITVLDMLSRDPETVRLAELRMKKILDEESMI